MLCIVQYLIPLWSPHFCCSQAGHETKSAYKIINFFNVVMVWTNEFIKFVQTISITNVALYQFSFSQDTHEIWSCMTLNYLLIVIVTGMCPEYNSRVSRIDVFQCSSSNCPPSLYWSNAVFICKAILSMMVFNILKTATHFCNKWPSIMNSGKL